MRTKLKLYLYRHCIRFIDMMTRWYVRDAREGNPYLDRSDWEFIQDLREKKKTILADIAQLEARLGN